MWLWLVAVSFIGMWIVLNRETKGIRGKRRGKHGGDEVSGGIKHLIMRLINFALFTVGTLSLWLAPMGSWGNIAAIIARVFRAVLGWFGVHLFAGAPASTMAFALSLPLMLAIAIDLWGRRPDKVARFGLLVLVPLCLVAGGPLAGAVIDITTSMTSTSAAVLQNLSG